MPKSDKIHGRNQVAERVEWLRKHHGLSQKEFAQSVGASSTQYNNWVSGPQRLSLDGALRIVEVYSVTLDFLYLGRVDMLPAHLAKAWLSRHLD